MFRKIVYAVAMALGFGPAVMAADLPARAEPVEPVLQAPATSKWGASFTPYMWMAGIRGEIGHGGDTLAHMRYDFSKVIDNLNFSAMGVAELRYDRFSLSSDLIYLRLTDHFAVKRVGLNQGKVGVGMLQWTPLAGYALLQNGRNRLEIVAGARVWSVKTLIGAEFTRFGAHSAERTQTWVDAVGGLRGRAFLNDNFFLGGWALAGGGGSDYMWDMMGGVGYRFNDMFSATAGYRAQRVQFREAGFLFDVAVHGPIVGVQISF